MNYFKKTKFRETSLIFVAAFIAIIYFTLSNSSEDSDVDVQALIDAAVEEAVEEALATTSDEDKDNTEESTTTTPTISALPAGNYWGQYSDGTWAIVLSSEKPENFEWAWDVFNREDPSGYYGFDEFDENSTLIGTLVDFDCSFNRISKTKEHKEAFGVFEKTIEYYDTYFDWAEDNYDYLTEEAVITISQIMRGVWTCDYDYLESISTEYLDFVHSGDAYAEVPKFSDYIASFENNYDDDESWGKYTYTLGALLYMTPLEFATPIPLLDCFPSGIQWIGNQWYQWPMESMDPKQLSEIQIAKMSMFDGGVTKSLIDGTYQGDDGTYGFRLQITTEGIWKAYKYTGHPWPSGYSKALPYYTCPPTEDVPESNIPFIASLVLNWYDESAPYYYKRTDEEIDQLNEYHSQEGNERILSITDSDGNEILNNVKIFFGTNSDVLNKGVGHYITSASPSMYKGNVAIAGYSKDEGYTPFENLHKVVAGSKIRWTHVPSGTYWEYTISKTFITSNSDISVLETVISDADADATITLITEDINDPSKILVLNGYLTDGNETG
jgi:LPXTG-site transpeptidase (sortase) family protein